MIIIWLNSPNTRSGDSPAHPLEIIADQKSRHQVNQPEAVGTTNRAGYRVQRDAEILKKAVEDARESSGGQMTIMDPENSIRVEYCHTRGFGRSLGIR